MPPSSRRCGRSPARRPRRPIPPADVEDEADDLAALDAAWEETAVSFGPGDALDGCSVDRLKTRLRAAKRAVTQSAA